jgi:hypothetical protein
VHGGVDGREDTRGSGDMGEEVTNCCGVGLDNDKCGGGIKIKGVGTRGRGDGIGVERGLSIGCSTGNRSTGTNSLMGPRRGII